MEDHITFCHERLEGLEIEHCKRHEPCSMPLYHYHDSYEIYYLLSGVRNYFIKDRTYKVEKGDLVLIDRHVLHKTTFGGSQTHERILVDLQEAYIGRLSQMVDDIDILQPFHRNVNVIKLQKDEQKIIEQLLFKMMKEAKERGAGAGSCIRLTAAELLITAARFAMLPSEAVDVHLDQVHEKISVKIQTNQQMRECVHQFFQF